MSGCYWATPAHRAKWPVTKMQCALFNLTYCSPDHSTLSGAFWSLGFQTQFCCHLQAGGQNCAATSNSIFIDSGIWLSFPFLIRFINIAWNCQNCSLRKKPGILTYSAHSQNTLFFCFCFSKHSDLIDLQCILGSLGSTLISEINHVMKWLLCYYLMCIWLLKIKLDSVT